MKKVGVSACLVGENVRYDGKNKANDFIINKLSKYVELIPICPEVSAGLGTPRPTIGIYRLPEGKESILINESSEDIGESLLRSFQEQVKALGNLDAVILKAKSPSCGINSASIHKDSKPTEVLTKGFFSKQLLKSYPNLLAIEEMDLKDLKGQEQFLRQLGLKPGL